MPHLRGMEQTLDLPPGYTLVGLREAGDAFAHGCTIAAEAGAGTLIWVRLHARAVSGGDVSQGTIWIAEDISERRHAEQNGGSHRIRGR